MALTPELATNLTLNLATHSDISLTPNFVLVKDDLTPEKKCANCDRPAHHRCNGCAQGVDKYGRPSRPVFYCGRECQRQHWKPTHKAECNLSKDREQLFRIGTILQWSFYEDRKVLWYDEIGKVRRVGQDGEGNSAGLLVWRNAKADATKFSEFPAALVDQERDKQALLVYGAPAVAMTSLLLQELLRGTKTQIQAHEEALWPKAAHYMRLFPRNAEPVEDSAAHWVFCVTLRDGSKFAIDIANAQYSGITAHERQCAVFPWDEYLLRLGVPEHMARETRALGYCFDGTRGPQMRGDINDAIAGKFLEEDVRTHTYAVAASGKEATLGSMQKFTGLTPVKLMHAQSAEYEKVLERYNSYYQRSLSAGRLTMDTGAILNIISVELQKQTEEAT